MNGKKQLEVLSDNNNIHLKHQLKTLNSLRFDFFTTQVQQIYNNIFEKMQAVNSDAIGDDKYTVATSTQEMLFIAKYI